MKDRLKQVYSLITTLEEQAKATRARKADAQEAIQKVRADMADINAQLAALDQVTMGDRLEALVRGKGSPATTQAAAEKAQAKAALTQHATDLKRDLRLLDEEVSRCDASAKELDAQLADRLQDAYKVVHDALCDQYEAKAAAFINEVVFPLYAIGKLYRGGGRAEHLATNVDINILVTGGKRSLWPSLYGEQFNGVRQQAVVQEMITAALAAE